MKKGDRVQLEILLCPPFGVKNELLRARGEVVGFEKDEYQASLILVTFDDCSRRKFKYFFNKFTQTVAINPCWLRPLTPFEAIEETLNETG